MTNKTGIACAALAACAFASPLAAKEGPYPVGDTFVIRASKLDLDSVEGRARLLRAVDRAMEMACEGEITRSEEARCKAEAMAMSKGAMSVRVQEALRLAEAEGRRTRMAEQR